MKGITLCAECAYYSMKKHKCTRGATDEGEPTARFYADCPLDDVAPVVRCKDCKYWTYDNYFKHNYCSHTLGMRHCCLEDNYCSYGERRTNEH